MKNLLSRKMFQIDEEIRCQGKCCKWLKKSGDPKIVFICFVKENVSNYGNYILIETKKSLE